MPDFMNRNGLYNPDNPNYFDPGVENGGDPLPYQIPPGTNPFDFGNTGDTGGSSGGNWWDNFKLSDILNIMPGVGSGDMSSALMIPAFAAAYKQWTDAGKYKDTAKEAMKYGDPFGQGNRDYYQQQLRNSYEHPEQVLMDPAHQATLKSGMDAVSRQDAMRGYLGSGNMAVDLTNYAQNENNKFLSQYRKDMMPLTGYQFDPSQAGKFLMQGNQQAIDSENAALGNMFLPFLNKASQTHITNNGGNTTGGNNTNDKGPLNNRGTNTPNPIDWSKYNSTPQQIQQELQQLARSVNGGLGGGTAAELFQRLLSSNLNVSDSTRMFMEDVMNGTLDGSNPLSAGQLGSTSLDDIFTDHFGFNGAPFGTFDPVGNFSTDPIGSVDVGDVFQIPEFNDVGDLSRITLDDNYFDFTGGDNFSIPGF